MRAAMFMMVGLFLGEGVAHAGDNNTVYIKQESPAGSQMGNTLMLDQSSASNSIVRGLSSGLLESLSGFENDSIYNSDVPGSSPLVTLGSGEGHALQRGEGNRATLRLEGYGGELQIRQDTSTSLDDPLPVRGTVSGNSATATLIGPSLGAIIQQGEANFADLRLNNAEGLISQTGTGLRATLEVGPSGSGQIVQIGSGSEATLSVSTGANATYTQIGNNLEAIGPAAVEVFATNPGNITITQTGF